MPNLIAFPFCDIVCGSVWHPSCFITIIFLLFLGCCMPRPNAAQLYVYDVVIKMNVLVVIHGNWQISFLPWFAVRTESHYESQLNSLFLSLSPLSFIVRGTRYFCVFSVCVCERVLGCGRNSTKTLRLCSRGALVCVWQNILRVYDVRTIVHLLYY